MDWFRSWHGAPTDPKWLLIAKRSETQAGVVSAIVWALFDFASQNSDDRGSVEAFDAETYAAFSGFDEGSIKRVIECLKEKKLIIDGHLAAWEKRQTKREDNSTPRVQKHRNAMKRNETQETAREEKRREEEIIEEKKQKEPREVAPSFDPKEFVSFWAEWPNKVGKPAAVKALAAARKRGVPFDAIMDGVSRYIRDKPPDRSWMNPATFLNGNRWEDQPARAGPAVLTEHQQRRRETQGILDDLDNFARGGGQGSEANTRLLPGNSGERPEAIRGGLGQDAVDLPRSGYRASG